MLNIIENTDICSTVMVIAHNRIFVDSSYREDLLELTYGVISLTDAFKMTVVISENLIGYFNMCKKKLKKNSL